MATDARWSIRPYEAGDEEAIRMLHEICHHKSWSLAQWRWQIRTLPTWWENEWVAVAEGQIIGHYAVTPVRFKFNDLLLIQFESHRRHGVMSNNLPFRDRDPFVLPPSRQRPYLPAPLCE